MTGLQDPAALTECLARVEQVVQDRPPDDQVHLIIPEVNLLRVHLDDRATERIAMTIGVRLKDAEKRNGQVARDHTRMGVELV